jgi:hypothetical protein
MVHTCNPSYSGGKDQEDHGLKPAWANSLRDSILKKSNTKKWLVVANWSSKPSTTNKTKQNKNPELF